ncbi:MAG: HAD family hydrolase [Oscillospiraceae bacterium]|nr:HAD family hydrolase [Oscillospiraceae bacterium]
MFDSTKIKAVLWDLDDTLYSRKQAARLTFPGMFQTLLYPGKSQVQLEEAADYMMTKVHRNSMVPLEAFLQLTEKYPPETPFDYDACLAYYYENMYKFARPAKAPLTVLQNLRAMGIKNAIVTNIPKERTADQWRKIRTLGLAPLFDAIVVSGDLDIHKPDRRIFDHTAKLLGVSNEECLFVGDDPLSDIAGARGANMEAVWLDSRWEDDPFENDALVHRVHSVTEYFSF